MRKNNYSNGVFVNTGFLRDHVSKLCEQKKLATILYENVVAMKSHGDPTVSYQYDSILQDVEQLMEYFGRMAKLLADVNDEAVQLNNELGGLIEDDADNTRHTVSSTFML